jgi:very-short-patch-repair endonuclease
MSGFGVWHLVGSATMQTEGRRPAPKWPTRAARRLRGTETSAEELLWRELRNRRLDGWKFRRQMPIAGHVVDFACVAARLTIEVDGKQHSDQIESDLARREKIEAAGFLEIRFTNDDVRGRPTWVIGEIRRVLDLARGEPMRPSVFRLD